jgi:hypothetical protein
MDGAPREATVDDSKRVADLRGSLGGLSPFEALLLLAALIGGLLLVAGDFSTLFEVRVGGVARDRVTGGDQHAYALAVIGAAAVPLALVATFGASRPAAFALGGLGLVAVAILLAVDLPDVSRNGYVSGFRSADSTPARGFYLEAAGAALVVLAGAAAVLPRAGRAG